MQGVGQGEGRKKKDPLLTCGKVEEFRVCRKGKDKLIIVKNEAILLSQDSCKMGNDNDLDHQ